MNTFIYASLIASLLSGPAPCINTLHNAPCNVVLNKINNNIFKHNLKVNYKELINKTDYLDAKLIFPILKGLKNKTIESTINSTIKKDILNFYTKIKNMALKNKENSIKNSYELIPYVSYTDFKIYTFNDDFISFYIDFYEFTGGAHGSTLRKSYNIDLRTGKFLTLYDVLKDIPNYKNIINQYIYNKITKKPDIYFSNTFKGISDDIPFIIEKNTLIIYFQQYEIAPYSLGIPEFKIPFFKLSNF